MHPTTDIICLVHNQLEITKKFVEHIFANTQYFNLIFVNNGSDQETTDWLVEGSQKHGCGWGWWRLVDAQINTGVIHGRNIGAEYIKSDYFLNIDNDQYVGPGWLDMLHAKMAEGYDIVGKEAWKLVKPGKGGMVVMGEVTQERSYFPHKHCTNKGEDWTYIGCGGTLIKTSVYKDIGLFDEQFNPAYFEDPDFCYDKETCVFTDLGFIPMKDVTTRTKVLTKCNNGFLEYQQPNWVTRKFENNLLHFKNQQVDIMCSKKQKLLVGYKRPAWKDVDEGKACEPNFISAEEISLLLYPRQCRYYIEKTSGEWVGSEIPTVTVCNNTWTMSDFSTFMGWYLSEGNICYNEESRKSRRDYSVTICQTGTANRDKYLPEITDLIKKLGFSPNINSKGAAFSNKELVNYLSQFGKCHLKYIPQIIKNSSPNIILDFLKAYIKGDGSEDIARNKWSFFTSSQKMKNDLHELLIKVGRSFTTHYIPCGERKTPSGIHVCQEMWQIQSYGRKTAYLPVPTVIDYDDYTYDINVDNHRILIMRNEKSCWSSNCFRAIQAGYKLAWCPECPIEHLGNQTTYSQKLFDKNAQFIQSWNRFKKKWTPYFPGE